MNNKTRLVQPKSFQLWKSCLDLCHRKWSLFHMTKYVFRIWDRYFWDAPLLGLHVHGSLDSQAARIPTQTDRWAPHMDFSIITCPITRNSHFYSKQTARNSRFFQKMFSTKNINPPSFLGLQVTSYLICSIWIHFFIYLIHTRLQAERLFLIKEEGITLI